MKAVAILPVKRFPVAKRRLGTGMSGRRRRDLVSAMVADVLEAISAARTIEQILIVSGEPQVAKLAHAVGAEVIDDPDDRGHSEAAISGIKRATELGATVAVLLPGDCPLLDPRELDGLLTGIPERYVAIVPDRHGTGTNALVLAPPDAIRPAFGEGSRLRHEDSARGAGLPWSVQELASLALDLDTPADLVALTRAVAEDPSRGKRVAKALAL